MYKYIYIYIHVNVQLEHIGTALPSMESKKTGELARSQLLQFQHPRLCCEKNRRFQNGGYP